MNNTHKVAGVQVSTVAEMFNWKQTYLDKKTKTLVTENLDMRNMTEEHIKKAYIKCQNKINMLQKQMDNWIDLIDKIEDVCKERDIELIYEEDYILRNNNIIASE